jgi:hypothetical protein
MKKALLIFLFLVFASGVSFAQTSQTGRTFSVRAYGAKCDNSTNDTAAFALTVAAVNASGGKMTVPAGTCLVDAATIAITGNGITIEGDGPNVSIIKSRTNTAGQIVLDTASSSLHTVTIKDLTLEGFGSGASNNGITVSGANTPFNIRFSNIRILSFTGRGIYDTAGMFQSRLDNVVVSQAATGNNAIDLLGSNDLLIQNCYVTVTGNSTAAYRIHSGTPTMISNNGINPGSTSASWAVFGDSVAEDGADRYVFAVMTGNNLEDFTANGMRFKTGSYGSFFGNHFIAPSSGTVTPLKFDFVDNGQRGIWDATNSIQTTGATYTNSNALNSRGAPFTQIGGNAFTSYYDTTLVATITFPYITPQLVAGSSNISLLSTRATITALESSGLVGDLTGATSFAGDSARVLLQLGLVTRPTFTFGADTNTGIYSSGADILDFTAGGTNRLSLSTNNTITGNTGVNVAGNSSYALDVASGALRVTNSNGSSTAAVEGKGNNNPYFLLTDSTASAILGRFQALSGAPDRLAIGAFSNHPFGLYTNSTEKWTVGTAGHFTPGTATTYNIGSASLPINDLTIGGKLYWTGSTVFDFSGSGTPEASITAAVGSVYRRTNGSTGTTLYIKETGSGNTGWVAVTASGGGTITGSGTTGALTKFTGATAIGDSLITESSTLLTTAGRQQINGITINTDATNTVASLTAAATFTKNDVNTRVFDVVRIKPTFNFGGANTSTTVNLLMVDSTNTAVTGGVFNLLNLAYGGTSKFSVDNLGAVVFANGVRQVFTPSTTVASLNFGQVASDPSSPVNGDCVYQTNTSKFRCYENSAWTNMIGATPTLTATQVAYGDGSNLLTSSSNFTWNNSTRVLTVVSAAGGNINLSTVSTNSAFQLNGATHPGTAGGVMFPFVGGGQSSGPNVCWTSSASYGSTSCLYLNNGLTFQGATSTHDHFKIAAATGTSSNGTVNWDWAPTSSLLTQTLSTSFTGNAHVGDAITVTSTGTTGANFGYQQTFTLENASASNVAATAISHTWATATAASEQGQILFSTNLAGAGVGQAFAISGSQFYGTYATANITGAATINFNSGNSQTLTLTGNVTATTLTGLQSGGLYFLIFKQDGTGSRTLASTNIKASGADLTITSTATTGRTLFTCMSDGTSLYCTKELDIR